MSGHVQGPFMAIRAVHEDLLRTMRILYGQSRFLRTIRAAYVDLLKTRIF